jgi:hypothetical protein
MNKINTYRSFFQPEKEGLNPDGTLGLVEPELLRPFRATEANLIAI